MILCANCAQLMHLGPDLTTYVHAETKKPQCAMRTNEERVIAQLKANDLKKRLLG